jgi:CHAT domain-containing protein
VGAQLRERAREALGLVDSDPRRAVRLARTIAREAAACHALDAASVAERALGLALLRLEGPDAALPQLRAAIRHGHAAGSAELAAEARMTLAITLNMRGHARQALREIDTAVRELTGVPRARARAQRAAILSQLGRLDAALPDYQAALAVLRQAGDHVWLQRVLYNRAVLFGYWQEFDAAEADLLEAEQLCLRHGLDLSLAFVHENLGWIRGLRGDVPAALHFLDLADRRLREHHMPVGQLLIDRCQLLLSVRLTDEAGQAAEQAVAEFSGVHRQLAVPEARLLLAQAAVMGGHPDRALDQARAATGEFARQQRPRWATLAKFAAVQATVAAAGGPASAGPVRLGRLDRIAADLDAGGWPEAAAEAHLLAGQLALHRGHASRAEGQLRQAARDRGRGPAIRRARAWYAEALLRRANGNRRGAMSAARAALRILDEQAAVLGATDLRAYAAGNRLQVAAFGLDMAFESGRASRILEWAEYGRASHLTLRPVRPPADPQLAAIEADLRTTVRQLSKLRQAGDSTVAVERRQIELEQRIRDQHRHLRGDPLSRPAAPVPAHALPDLLGPTVLVEFVQRGDALHAVVVADGRMHLHETGSAEVLRQLVDRARFALHRLARRHADPTSLDAARALLTDVAARLDRLLLSPIAHHIGDRPIVVVPTGPVQSLPWSILPSCAGRPVTVAPSAALWHAAQRPSGKPTDPILIAAGPGLPGAYAEATAVAAIHRVSPIVQGGATVEVVRTALDGAQLAHLGTHGTIHPRNPLFSSLALADGPLTVYDLERLQQAPHLVVLAACDAGRSAIPPGDELIGLSATLLALGATNAIASVAPIPDGETAPLMIEVHQRLAAGESAASALAEAQQHLYRDYANRAQHPESAAILAAAAGFISIGADTTLPAAA